MRVGIVLGGLSLIRPRGRCHRARR
jgi:hypothetical protein